MQFVVPQFIDVENKIIGPISTRQFILLVIMAIIAFVLFKAVSSVLFGIGLVLDIIIFGSLAFVKINSQHLHIFVLVLIQTFKRPTLRTWQKFMTRADIHEAKQKKSAPKTVPMKKRLTNKSRLAELSLIVDTGGAYHDEVALQGIQSTGTVKNQQKVSYANQK